MAQKAMSLRWHKHKKGDENSPLSSIKRGSEYQTQGVQVATDRKLQTWSKLTLNRWFKEKIGCKSNEVEVNSSLTCNHIWPFIYCPDGQALSFSVVTYCCITNGFRRCRWGRGQVSTWCLRPNVRLSHHRFMYLTYIKPPKEPMFSSGYLILGKDMDLSPSRILKPLVYV